ncbi:MAG TPA: RagB/SusD family nutrient uptake outer membrane protein, partial [Gemmatimonadaceae bacterium]|nr:RagB/SusD family nutrient uptake outer membrane protein [Gemmatimonadaceae bacterium]
MRRIVTASLGLVLLGGIGACVDLDEKLVSNLNSQYLETQAGVTAGVNSVYQQLRGFYGREQQMALTELGTDIFTNGDQVSSGAQAWFYLNDYTSGLNSTDGRIQELWNPMYVLIARANAVIEAADKVPEGGDLPAALKASRIGEAKFLRALAYFELVRHFGDVTLNVSAASGVATDAVRAPEADVYKQIIADLEAAVAALPATQNEWGRAHKGAAQHLLAKVYLTRGYKSYGEGNADFTKALSQAQAVINSGQYALTPVYADLFCGTHTADQNAPDPNRQGFCNVLNYNERQPEILFSVQYSYSAAQTMGPQCNNSAGICGNYLHLAYLSRYDNDNNIAAGLPRDLNNGRPFRRMRGTPFLFSLYDKTRWTGTPGQSDILDTRFDGTFQTLWYATATGTNSTGACPNCTSGGQITPGDTAIWMPGYRVTDAFRRAREYVIYE